MAATIVGVALSFEIPIVHRPEGYDMSTKAKLVVALAVVALAYVVTSSGGDPVEIDPVE